MKPCTNLLFAAIILIVIGLDQLVKFFVYSYLPLGMEIALIPTLSLLHARNEGIAFSLFSTFGNSLLILLTIIVTLAVFMLWRRSANRCWMQYGYALIIGGALANLIDRIRFHYVVDYIYFHIGNIFQFAIFNLADTSITIGAILVLVYELFFAKRAQPTA